LDNKWYFAGCVFPGSAQTNIGWGRKLNGQLMASCVRNIYTNNYQNLVIVFQVTVKNVGDYFLRHSVCAVVQCISLGVIHEGRLHWEGGEGLKLNADKGGHEGRGFQWKRITHVGIWLILRSEHQQPASATGQIRQTDVTDTSCITAPVMRLFWDLSAEIADEWD